MLVGPGRQSCLLAASSVLARFVVPSHGVCGGGEQRHAVGARGGGRRGSAGGGGGHVHPSARCLPHWFARAVAYVCIMDVVRRAGRLDVVRRAGRLAPV